MGNRPFLPLIGKASKIYLHYPTVSACFPAKLERGGYHVLMTFGVRSATTVGSRPGFERMNGRWIRTAFGLDQGKGKGKRKDGQLERWRGRKILDGRGV